MLALQPRLSTVVENRRKSPWRFLSLAEVRKRLGIK
jgi:hypothetical protein